MTQGMILLEEEIKSLELQAMTLHEVVVKLDQHLAFVETRLKKLRGRLVEAQYAMRFREPSDPMSEGG